MEGDTMSDTSGEDHAPDVGNGIEMARITIVKTFDDDAEGGAGIWTSYSDGLGLADALGMLAYSQATTFRTYMGDDQ